MKTNKMLRISAILLVLTLLSTCVISGTFAKYVTSDSKADAAKVAKWGVTVTANLADLFEEGYTETNEATVDKNTASVLSSVNSVNMLAPGTTDTQEKALVITGTPEVRVKVEYIVDLQLANWVIDTTELYCPLVITVNIDGVATEFKNNDASALETAVENHILALNDEYNPNADLSKTISISWKWAYSVDEATDIKDTKLGNAANASFYIKLGATVTQVD